MTPAPRDPDTETRAGTVTPERFARVRAIFEAALERSVHDRRGFVDGACAGDAVLLHEVQAMLAADATGAPLLDRPPSTPSSSAPEEGRFPAGTVLAGRYRILGRLGQGGMGEVYRAHDLILNQTVALKFLVPAHPRPGWVDSAVLGRHVAALARFRNEVRIARQVSHPHVCRVYDLGMVEGLHFLSMEYIDGEDLASLLRRIGRLPQDKAIEFTRKICAGLSAAHERGVLHRDLKPANIMIDGRGQPRITDFGLAGLAAEIPLSDLRSGTPAYMSPEQKAGKDVTTRSDIYSLGLVLHEMFTGKARTHPQSNPTDLVKDLDPAIERLILRCLEEDPKRRPSSALSVAMALPGGDPIAAALAAGETPSPEMVAASQEKEGFSPRVAIACFVAALVSLVAGTFLSTQVGLLSKSPLEKPPDVLADDARELLLALGYPETPASRYYGFERPSSTESTLPFFRDRTRWEPALATQQPPFVRFWYRQHRDLFYADAIFNEDTATGGVAYDSPANTEPGMIRMVFDPIGRLTDLEVRPWEARIAGTPDWMPLLAATGLDLTRFTPAEPAANPPMAADTRAAWVGTYEKGRTEAVRVEVAAWGARPVFLSVTQDGAQTQDPRPLWVNVALLLLYGGIVIGGVLLAWRNVRLGRSDTRGAAVVAVLTFSGLLGVEAISAAHVLAMWEARIVATGICEAGLVAAIQFVLYLAMEPYARRHWPDSLISWKRFQSGRLRDVLVASHVLAGTAAMLAWRKLGLGLLSIFMPASVEVPHPQIVRVLESGAFPVLVLLRALVFGVQTALLLLIAVILLRLLLRRVWIADGIVAVLVGLLVGGVTIVVGDSLAVSVDLAHRIVAAGIVLWLMRRLGLLAAAAAWTTFYFAYVPYVPGAWFAGRTLVTVAIPAVIAGWALWVILSAQRTPATDSVPS